MTMAPHTKEKFKTNVITFPPRATKVFKKQPLKTSTNDICELLDLSRYEFREGSRNDLDSQKDGPDDFKSQMRTNIMALIFLMALAGLAAIDVIKLAVQI